MYCRKCGTLYGVCFRGSKLSPPRDIDHLICHNHFCEESGIRYYDRKVVIAMAKELYKRGTYEEYSRYSPDYEDISFFPKVKSYILAILSSFYGAYLKKNIFSGYSYFQYYSPFVYVYVKDSNKEVL